MITITKELLAQWITELDRQPHRSLKEERYLLVMKMLYAVYGQEPVGLHHGRTAAGWRAEALLQKATAEQLRGMLQK